MSIAVEVFCGLLITYVAIGASLLGMFLIGTMQALGGLQWVFAPVLFLGTGLLAQQALILFRSAWRTFRKPLVGEILR